MKPHRAAAVRLLPSFGGRLGCYVGELYDDEPQPALLGDDRAEGNVYEAAEDADAKGNPQASAPLIVGNPPYITVRGQALNGLTAMRTRGLPHRGVSLIPVHRPFFDSALTGDDRHPQRASSNDHSQLVRQSAKVWQQKHRGDVAEALTSTHQRSSIEAYIPGTAPTVILFGRNRAPVAMIRAPSLGIGVTPRLPAPARHGV